MGRHQSLSIVIGLALFATALPFIVLLPPLNGFGTQKDFIGGFADAGVFVLLAIGLNVVVGFAGLLDLGYAAFFAIGAYTYAYGASPFSGLDIPFWPMLLVGAIVAAMFGVLLGAPTLRLRGDYLAIVTLGFGEIVPVVFLNADKYTNGTNGITGLAQPSAYGLFGINGFGFTNPLPYFVTVVVIIAVAFIFLYRLQDSRIGRAWVAIREDELAAASMGINTVTTKLLAFSIGASTSGLAGVFYASKLSIVSPDQFGFTVSFTALAMVVLGGMGNIAGPVLGAIIWISLQEWLKDFSFVQNHPEVRGIAMGLVLVLLMVFRPQGLLGSRRVALEMRPQTAKESQQEREQVSDVRHE